MLLQMPFRKKPNMYDVTQERNLSHALDDQIVNNLQSELSTMAKTYNRLLKRHSTLLNDNQKQKQKNAMLKNVIHNTTQINIKVEKPEATKACNVHKEELSVHQIKFRNWMIHVVGLKQYLSLFLVHECDHIAMIEFLDEDFLQNELGIKMKPHYKLILKRAKQFKAKMKEFNEIVKNSKVLAKYKQRFIELGILTLQGLKDDIKTEEDVKRLLDITDHDEVNNILSKIHHGSRRKRKDKVTEGHAITYHFQ
eukprot:38_1